MQANQPLRVRDVIAELEAWAPPALQESYDNSGLLVGDRNAEVTGVLVSLDCTEEVVAEAAAAIVQPAAPVKVVKAEANARA